MRAEIHSSYLRILEDVMARPEPRRCSMPGVDDLLELLAERKDVTLGLLTGNLEAGARIKLEPFGLKRFSEGWTYGDRNSHCPWV